MKTRFSIFRSALFVAATLGSTSPFALQAACSGLSCSSAEGMVEIQVESITSKFSYFHEDIPGVPIDQGGTYIADLEIDEQIVLSASATVSREYLPSPYYYHWFADAQATSTSGQKIKVSPKGFIYSLEGNVGTNYYPQYLPEMDGHYGNHGVLYLPPCYTKIEVAATGNFSSQGGGTLDISKDPVSIVTMQDSQGNEFTAQLSRAKFENNDVLKLEFDDPSGLGAQNIQVVMSPQEEEDAGPDKSLEPSEAYNFQEGANRLSWSFWMGKSSNGISAGNLVFSTTQINAQTFSEPGVEYTVRVGETEFRYGDYGVRQSYNSDRLVDVVPVDANSFQVKIYNSTGTETTLGGYYVPNGTLLESWVFENPGNSSGGNPRMKVSLTRGGVTRQTMIEQIGTQFVFTDIGGERRESTNWQSTTVSGVNKRIKTHLLQDLRGGSPVTLEEGVETYQEFSWGWELVKKVEDPSGANLITLWTYYDELALTALSVVVPEEDPRFSKTFTEQRPDGSWSKYLNYSAGGSALETLQAWKDVTLASATVGNARWTVVSAISGGYRTQIYTAGVLSGKSEYTESTASGVVTRTSRTFYGSGGTNYLDTVTRSDATTLRTLSVTRPGALVDTYVNENGNWNDGSSTFTVSSGGPARRTTVKHGTVSSPDGVSNQSTWERSVTDGNGNSVLQETLLYTGSGGTLLTAVRSHYNADGNLVQSVKDGRVVEDQTWSQGLLTSSKDEQGIVTNYSYDTHGRVLTETRAGLLTTYHYNPLGQTESTTVEPVGGGEQLGGSSTYWPSGDLKTQVDENGLTSSYSYSVDGSGHRVETVLRPDGATEITTYFLDGQLLSRTGTGVIHEFNNYTVESSGNITSRLSIGSASSVRYRESTADWMGRSVLEQKPAYTGTWSSVSTYDSASGRLISKTQTGLANSLYEYDSLGRQTRQGLDVNSNGTLDPSSADPITESVQDYVQSGGNWYERTVQKQWLSNGSGTATTIETVRDQISGLNSTTLSHVISTDIYGNDTDSLTTVNRTSATVTSTTDLPESSINVLSVSVNGRQQSQNSATVATNATAAYDDLGRTLSSTDAAGNTTSYTYRSGTNQIATVTPPLGASEAFTYWGQGETGAGQIRYRDTKEGGTLLSRIETSYDLLGHATGQSGSGTYPVGYGYDSTYGDRTTMTTWRDGGAGDVTTWIYQPKTGLLTRKQYADAKGTNYTYADSGLLASRTWQRGVSSTYSYDLSGNLTGIDYSDATADKTYTVNRVGRITAVTDAGGSHALSYANDGQLNSDAITGTGILSGVTVTNGHDTYGRRNSFTATGTSGTLVSQASTYESGTGRLWKRSAGGHTATYGYKANTDLVETTTFNNGSSNIMTRTVVYDALSRIGSVTATTGAGTVASHTYAYDSRGRRTRIDREDGAYWSYGYNNRDEVESGVKKFSDNTAMPGHQFAYQFDDIGNRESTTQDGTSYSYSANSVNQITSHQVPASYVISGTAVATSAITVNDAVADRKGDFWSKALTVNNSSAPAYPAVSVEGRLSGAGPSGETVVAEQTGHLLVPKTPEALAYDDDGNLLNDGLWNYTWDGENRLIAMESVSAVPAEAKKKLEFSYDYANRRIQKKVSKWNVGSSSYQLQATLFFVYDGWNLVAELEGTGALRKTFLWGADLSGSEQGAGGVGGLLSSFDLGAGINCYYNADVNGNITTLIKTSDGSLVADYEYSPFGELLKKAGISSSISPFLWSSKYFDSETKLSYYGFRFYNSSLGRWVNRDLIEEQGGLNLYVFAENNSLSKYDIHGMWVDEMQVIGPIAAVDKVKSVEHSLFGYAPNVVLLAKLGETFFPGAEGRGSNNFVFTCKYGWIDMGHFFLSAADASIMGKDAYMHGYMMEIVQGTEYYFTNDIQIGRMKNLDKIFKGRGVGGMDDSAFTPEDLWSDYEGTEFGSQVSRSGGKVWMRWKTFLKNAGAVSYNKKTARILYQDVEEWEGERVFFRSTATKYKEDHSAWKCLCDGDTPVDFGN